MKFSFKLERDGNYYFGLALLVVASASILWAFFYDGFEPKDFLAYFLIYAWGFTLLLKSDSEYRLNRLEEAVTVLQSRLDKIEGAISQQVEAEDGDPAEVADTVNQVGTEQVATDGSTGENTPIPTGQNEEE